MAKKSYDKAYADLQNILAEMQGENVSIDKLGEKIKKATTLINFCKERLRSIEDEIKGELEE